MREDFRTELKRLASQCTPEKERECSRDLKQNLESVCSQCEGNLQHEPDAWFQHIWFLYRLQNGGYPFGREDLSIEEWIDLGILKEELLHINAQ